MFHIEFMNPQMVWIGVPIAAAFAALVAWYNLRALEGSRKFWGDRMLLKAFSPRDGRQSISLWVQWGLFLTLLVITLAGPNTTQSPQMVPAGAVQVEYVFDVSPSSGAEDYRSFLPAPPGGRIPDSSFQWGTRLDAAKHYLRQDLMPQLIGNEAGLVTVMGAGYNMWDITRDLAPTGAFNHMLEKFVQVSAAPGSGADFTSGLQAALDEFTLIGDLQRKMGDTAEKVKFIVLFSDGGFTGDIAELNKVLDRMKEAKVRLLVVALGGDKPITVPKYDPKTKRRNGEFFPGLTKVDTNVLRQMVDRVKGTLILAPPGTKSIEYSFPQQSGGLYARPSQSNLKFWFLLAEVLLLASITTGGGGLPRWRYFVPELRKSIATATSSIKFRLGRRS